MLNKRRILYVVSKLLYSAVNKKKPENILPVRRVDLKRQRGKGPGFLLICSIRSQFQAFVVLTLLIAPP